MLARAQPHVWWGLRIETASDVRERDTNMLERRILSILGLIALCFSTAWGRAEFHIGGVAGTAWQGLINDKEVVYVVVDGQGGVLSDHPIAIGVEETGIDTMIDYANNAIQPVRVDPEVNLALDTNLIERNGNLYTSVSTGYTKEAAKEVQVMIDGDPETATLRQVEISPRLAGLNIGYVKNTVLNLGAEMPVNRIVFYPRPGFEENYLAWYEIGVAGNIAPFMASPQERAPGRRWYRDISRSLTSLNDPAFDVLERNVENLDQVVDLRFPTRDLRWVAIRPINPERTWEIAEMEVYGEGYVSKTTYRTGVLDFGRPVAWSKIRWEGEVPQGTRLVMRTRSGSTPQPNLFWMIGSTGIFERVPKEEYVTTYQVGRFSQIQATYDVENWSFWSTPYDFSGGLRDLTSEASAWQDGTDLLAPGPSRYLQLEVVMFSDGDRAPRIDNLSLLFAENPSAQTVIAEIWPVETEDFEPQTFTYVVRPVLESGDRGFDRLEIFTQVPASAISSVQVDGREIMEEYPPQIKEDRILISFDPFVAPRDNERRIEVVFDAKVLRFGSEFTGWVYDSAEPELKQQVRAGNATFRFAGDVLSVRTPVGGELVRRVRAWPPTLTPNGDGINDETRISYDLRNIGDPRQVDLQIFDLAGRVVRQVFADRAVSGSFEAIWDGRDESGALVVPGLYLYQVDLATDEGSSVETGTVSVAY